MISLAFSAILSRGLKHKLVSNEIHGPTWVKRVLPEALASHPEMLLDPKPSPPETPEHPEKPEDIEEKG